MDEVKLSKIKEQYSIDSVHSVSSLNDYLCEKFQSDNNLDTIHLLGEVSNLSITDKDHMFFDMKDKGSKIPCVIFGASQDKKELVEAGKEILIHGKVDFYKAQGRAQIMPFKIMPVGEGILANKLKKLKEKLKDEGLFDVSRKKSIPFLPQKIGIITSKGRDAIRDMVNSIHGRFPNMDIFVYHSAVQGEASAPQLCDGIEFFNLAYPVDVIIMGRGGGSLEDLMPFNDETVSRAISDSSVPIITGIGHQYDESIADYTADVHEITPTAAGKKAVPDKVELVFQLERQKSQLDTSSKKYIKMKEQEKEIKEKKKEIANKETKIKETKKEIVTQEKEIKETKKELISQEKEIKDKENVIVSQVKIIEHEKKMSLKYQIIIYSLIILILAVVGWMMF